jgi:multidrug efflux pump subunit AcrA (membrane-fusion protein)
VSPQSIKTLRSWLLIALLIAAAATLGWWGYQRLTRPSVVVTQVVLAPVVEAFYATGTLLPDREYPIRTHVEGTVTQVHVDKGDAVTRDMVLATVRDEQRQMRYSQAVANHQLAQSLAVDPGSPVLQEFDARISAADEQLQIAQRELDRVATLRQTDAAAQTDHDRAQDRVETMRALVQSLRAQRAARKLELQRDLEVAKAALDIAQWNLDEQTLKSPIDGMVLDRPVPVGTRMKINDDLMRVAQVAPQRLVMRAAVDEEDRTHLSIGQVAKVSMYAYPGRVFDGTVERVYPQADPQRRTFEVDVRLAQSHEGFAAGMTGELAFIVAQRDSALVVPSQAVHGEQVWIYDGGTVRPQAVQVGLRSIERVEVAGLQEGQRVVISPVNNLAAGQAVSSSFMEPATAAGINTPAQQQAGGFRGFN